VFLVPAIYVVILGWSVEMQKLSTYNKDEVGDAMYCFRVCCNTVIFRGALEFVRADTIKQ
jgi:hypothetical protein